MKPTGSVAPSWALLLVLKALAATVHNFVIVDVHVSVALSATGEKAA